MAQRRNNGNRKFAIFAIRLLPRIKTVADTFVSPVVNAWLGHSSKVAEKHYLQVTDEHWESACTLTGSHIPADLEVSGTSTNARIPTNNGLGYPVISISVPLQGLEPWTW